MASELLRQLNAKTGNDLYHLSLPKLPHKHTMLIGIDVCHYGPKSIVGFCSTTNENFSKYYSQTFYQQKGKEIGNEKLEGCFLGALKAYEDYNKAKVQHVIIYRDGVGDGMRAQVNREELRMLLSCLKKHQPLDDAKVTLMVVNKRINQRFFEKTDQHLI